uniref:Uncharacterized protein n=1 Tax=Nelumbo nucifera TaxID=4432 RepID=A0A822ZTE9_NELNU|nr:TPA_asm: hypothetical protein HUJ06_018150 [Nelumbo nucifera]
MVLKISSKFELRRFCRTTGSVALLKLSHPNPDELGYADSISVEEIGGVRVVESGLRGSTDSILDDLERAVDDGVNTYKAMCRDSRIIPGAAANEIELARRLKEFSFKETGCLQGCNCYGYLGPPCDQVLCPQISGRCCLHCASGRPDYNGKTSGWSKERSTCSGGRGLAFDKDARAVNSMPFGSSIVPIQKE